MKNLKTAFWMLGLTALAACGGAREEILTGERNPLRAEASDALATDNQARAINLAAPQLNSAWTHRAGGPGHRIAHPALGTSLSQIWSSDIGAGDTRRTRLTADPVVASGRVFTLDSLSQVSSLSAATGAASWRVSVAPSTDNGADGSGGGLAVAGDQVFVTTGFGELRALDAVTGATQWVQELEASAGAAPTVFDGLVYLAGRDGTAWALDATSGRIKWQVNAAPSQSNLMGGPGVAVNDRVAIFPFATGELLATFRRGGVRLWGSSVSGGRDGQAYAQISDISGDPVIAGDRVYVGNQSGRIAALDLSDGARIWTAAEGAMGPVAVAGGSVFAVTDRNAIVRLDASTGTRIWGVDLPLFVKDNPARRKAVFAHYGPVLAGGRLYVASSDGSLRAFSPETGAQLASLSIPGGAASAPVIAERTLYVVSKRGQLLAFR